TAKALVELPSPYAGVVAALHARAGETVNVGDPLVTFAVTPADRGPAPTDDARAPNLVGYGARPEHSGRPTRRPRRDRIVVGPPLVAPPGVGSSTERPRSTPPVRHLARRLGVDL